MAFTLRGSLDLRNDLSPPWFDGQGFGAPLDDKNEQDVNYCFALKFKLR